MRTALLLALVLATGCKDKKQAASEPPPKPTEATPTTPVPKPEVKAETPAALPASCTAYIAAVEKLKTCEKAAGVRDTFLQIFETDQEVLTGKRPAPASALETLCAARNQNVQSVIDSQCSGPLDTRTVEQLKSELDKTSFAIAAANAVASDSTQKKELRAEAKSKVPALQKEKAELEALIQQKEEGAKAERLKGVDVSKECLENPLAKGCS